jgi:predicted dehydrogenase
MSRKAISDIRAAIVGTGFIGFVHLEALRRLGVQVAGVVGSSPERARERTASHLLRRVYESYDEMLGDPGVDVVHVATPNHLHHGQVRAALQAGKHVVCEKPLGVASSETAELLALAQQSGLVHATNFNIRFYPLCQQARASVLEGKLGEVRLLTGSYLQDWLLYDTDWNWRLDAARGGASRAIADIGSHWLDLVTFITGLRAEAVMADLATFVPVRYEPSGPIETFGRSGRDGAVAREIATEDAASVLVRFQDGARGAFTVSQVSAGRKNALSFQIDGSRTALAWCSERPEELWIGHRDRANEVVMRDPALLSARSAGWTDHPGGHAEGFPDTFKQLFRAIYRGVADGRPGSEEEYPTFLAGHREALAGEAILRSARDGKWATVEGTLARTAAPRIGG